MVIPGSEDPVEFCFNAGYTDGMPVVPPTEARVERMLRAVDRDPQEVIGAVAPNYGAATVEKIAINAVMAGCAPEYMPVLLAGVKAMCSDEFNLHGIQATTHSATPLVLVNGPITERLGINGGLNAFGQGWRANATIGRALKLIMQNTGGCRPAEIDRSTQGNPGKFSFCIAENAALSPWEPYHVEHGFRAEESTITLFAAEAPHAWSDHGSRTAEQVVACMGHTLASSWNHKGYPLIAPIFLALCPEHARIIAKDGWSKADIRSWLVANIRRPLKELLPGPDGGESLAQRFAGENPSQEMLEMSIGKFMSEDDIHTLVVGGDGGMFSSWVPGWVGGSLGSVVTTEVIEDPGA